MGRQIHPDLPEVPDDQPAHTWDYPAPLDDLAYALESAGEDGHTLADIAEVTDYSISYHGAPWTPGEDGGTELTLIVLARLTDGRWLAMEAWNDYTGWGCQDGVDAYVGPTREDVVTNGLTNDARSALGIETV
ncbi:hypothetical protein [Nocardioides kongjuensis]|uniref:Uncharacterized protein n=1 Tax=Nocardioides kongjuensis TaxID=349522 RepID=A0A852RTN0_9ACTN|nr:hypothetical protein [Nocardioides kongjuensis]NYD33868.1 hypothetical protein [Nocardioides kongjuensis]